MYLPLPSRTCGTGFFYEERRKTKKIPENIWGPVLITGASDDDPSGIVTYSQVGAGYGLTGFSGCRCLPSR